MGKQGCIRTRNLIPESPNPKREFRHPTLLKLESGTQTATAAETRLVPESRNQIPESRN
jgi:hypothetical protein